LQHSDPDLAKRNWQHVMDEMGRTESGSTKKRWDVAIKVTAFDQIRYFALIKTQAEHLLNAMFDNQDQRKSFALAGWRGEARSAVGGDSCRLIPEALLSLSIVDYTICYRLRCTS
jgi:hypothetical protein